MKILIYLFVTACAHALPLTFVNASSSTVIFNIDDTVAMIPVKAHSVVGPIDVSHANIKIAETTYEATFNVTDTAGNYITGTPATIYDSQSAIVSYSPDSSIIVEGDNAYYDGSGYLYLAYGFSFIATLEILAMMRRMAGKIGTQTGGEV